MNSINNQQKKKRKNGVQMVVIYGANAIRVKGGVS